MQQANAIKEEGQFSIQRLAYYVICLCIVLVVLYVGASFFIPIVFGVFFTFMLKPLRNFYEHYVRSRVAAILLAMSTSFLTIGGVLAFFVMQVMDVMTEADDIVAEIKESSFEVMAYCGEFLGMRERETFALFNEQLDSFTAAPLGLLTSGLSTSGAMFANFSLVVIYTFFFLLYSTAIRNFIMGQFRGSIKEEGGTTIREIQEVATSYLEGILIVMLILGILNSLGLWLIGIRFPLVWGFMGAMLAVIPYVGTALGGLLPFLYAVATVDTYWQPIAVIVLYTVVQSIEGNLITPKVVGNSVKINALAAILSLIFGALFWGIAGVILAIPLLAMVRVVLDHINPTKPFALLLSDDLYGQSHKFLDEYNADAYRLRSLFKKNVKPVKVKIANSSEVPNEISHTDAEVVANTEAQ
ncbi:AI-2E family transporter [Lewinella sp. 4G2]|uniref:AI-2E family transporter n=1 Tax=Lewinella sp. 4G2 TaxID=1803372 RepID=UPI0007B468A8|nr:AI-2E family transporter [Lewinella sp. 4G2]OAV45414.1 hypothetical protein A3850_013330 [Lewinella sp. 4G2]